MDLMLLMSVSHCLTRPLLGHSLRFPPVLIDFLEALAAMMSCCFTGQSRGKTKVYGATSDFEASPHFPVSHANEGQFDNFMLNCGA